MSLPTYTMVRQGNLGALTLPCLGRGNITIPASSANFTTNPSTYCPLFLNYAPGGNNMFGLTGGYIGKNNWNAGTQYTPTMLQAMYAFQCNALGIFDITAAGGGNASQGWLGNNNSGKSNTIQGRDGLYSGIYDGGNKYLFSSQRTYYPPLVFGNKTIPFSTQAKFWNGNYAYSGTIGNWPTPTPIFTIIDDSNVEHLIGTYITCQTNSIYYFYTYELALDITNYTTYLGTQVLFPLQITKNGNQSYIQIGLHNYEQSTSLISASANPYSGEFVAFGLTVGGYTLYRTNMICNAAQGVVNVPGYNPLVLGNSTDNNNLMTYGDASAIAITMIPGGHIAVFVGGYPQALYLIKNDYSGYYAITLSYPSGASINYRPGRFGFDITGNLWTLAVGNVNNYSGVYSTVGRYPGFNFGLNIDIQVPMLNSFGLSCRTINPCTMSFEG